jgi:glutamyl/glutaminyl-tRNA synthetase
MNISHVIRGEGHLSNTHRQVLIYEALGAVPPAFAHLSTILGKDGEKLSKRHGATSVLEFRKMGYLPEAMVNYLSLLGWAPPGEGQEILSIDETIRLFSLDRVNRHPAIFDPEKLNWVSRNHIKSADPGLLVQLAAPYLQKVGWLPEELASPVLVWLEQVILAVRNYLDRLEQITSHTSLIFQYDPGSLSEVDKEELLQPESGRVMEAFLELCRDRRIQSMDDYKAVVLEVRNRTGVKGRKLFHPIRLALTGTTSGLELESLIPLLEQGADLRLPRPVEGCAQRISRMIEFLRG